MTCGGWGCCKSFTPQNPRAERFPLVGPIKVGDSIRVEP